MTGRARVSDADLARQFRRIFDHEPSLAERSDAARRVLATAGVLFYRHGSAATSVRRLASACGLSPGALYNHFDSRDDVLYALVSTGHAMVERAVALALARADGTPEDALRHFVRAYTERHLAFPAYAQLVHREYVHLAAPRRAEIVERRRGIRERLVQLLSDGAAARRFTLIDGPDAPVRQAMMVLDMCSRTSEWFNPSSESVHLSERYVTAALRLVGACDAGPG